MPQIQSLPCLLCGLRFENGTLLEAHIHADHLRRHSPAPPDPGTPGDDGADRPSQAAPAGRRRAGEPSATG
jgi:hypothetical protein